MSISKEAIEKIYAIKRLNEFIIKEFQ